MIEVQDEIIFGFDMDSVLAKEWKSGAPLLLSIPFSFDVVERM